MQKLVNALQVRLRLPRQSLGIRDLWSETIPAKNLAPVMTEGPIWLLSLQVFMIALQGIPFNTLR